MKIPVVIVLNVIMHIAQEAMSRYSAYTGVNLPKGQIQLNNLMLTHLRFSNGST